MRIKSSARRKDRLIKDNRKDTYIDQIALKDPAACSKCNAVYILTADGHGKQQNK